MENMEIRRMLKAEKVKQIEVASKIGITDSSLSRLMRYPLSIKNKERILAAVGEILKERKSK